MKLVGYSKIAHYITESDLGWPCRPRTVRRYAARPSDPLPVKRVARTVVLPSETADAWMERQPKDKAASVGHQTAHVGRD